jgi:hypothetical protein
VQIAALILLLLVIPMSGSPNTPDVLSPIGVFAIGMLFSAFYGAVLLVVRAGYWFGVRNGEKSLRRGGI